MFSRYEQMEACTVIVEGGTGVLIQPMSDSYAYILTAKHVIENKLTTAKNISATASNNSTISIEDLIFDKEYDIAILKTRTVIESSLIRIMSPIKSDDVLYLLGFPEIRRAQNNKLRDFTGKVTSHVKKDIFTIRLEETPDQPQLNGISGCGVFMEKNDTIFLCGIEYQLDGNTQEHHGRVNCAPLSLFDKLIRENSNFSPLFPPYMSNFSYVKEYSFLFNGVGLPDQIKFLKQQLNNKIDQLIHRMPKPKTLFERHEQSLLIADSPSEAGLDKQLWISLLEFLVISSIIDKQDSIDTDYLTKKADKRKFLFSAETVNWYMLLSKILRSDLTKLGNQGVVIVSVNGFNGTHTPSPNTLNKIIGNIGQTIPETSKLRIDTAIKNPAQEFIFYHWQGLHKKCVIEKEDEYLQFNTSSDLDVLEKLGKEYAQFLHQQQ